MYFFAPWIINNNKVNNKNYQIHNYTHIIICFIFGYRYDQTIPQDEIDQNEGLVATSNGTQQSNVSNKTSNKTLYYDNMSSLPRKKAISKTYSQQTINVTNHNSGTLQTISIKRYLK